MGTKDRLARLRRAVLREWRGGDDPEHLDHRVHQPGEFLAEILKHAGAAEGVDLEKLKEAWREIAGEFVARNAAPDSLKGGCLTLKVLQPAMRFHLEQMKGKLLKNLKESDVGDSVKSIRFTLG